MNKKIEEHYLGDGLYASDDGWQVILRAPRGLSGDHFVALESDVLNNFFLWLEKTRGLKITVQKLPNEGSIFVKNCKKL